MDNPTQLTNVAKLRGIATGEAHDSNKDRDYFFEEQRRVKNKNSIPVRLYDYALNMEYNRIFQQKGLEPLTQLKLLKEEILVRTKIVAQEIFFIGQLLTEAKELCQRVDKKFQDWIEENFDFSYDTAHNFMNVYQHCLGYRELALNIKPSILYKVSSPGFPEELRKYLFEQGALDDMTNGKLRKITEKFKSEGFEAVKENLESLEHVQRITRQVAYSMDMTMNIYRTLIDLQDKLGKMGFKAGMYSNEVERGLENREEEANKILLRLDSAVKICVGELKKALDESRLEMNIQHEKALSSCGVVDPDGRVEKWEKDEFQKEEEEYEKESIKEVKIKLKSVVKL